MFLKSRRRRQHGCPIAAIAAAFLLAGSANADAPMSLVGRPATESATPIAVAEVSGQPLAELVEHAPGAAWMRVRFERVDFPGFAPGQGGYLRITSLFDGAVQILDADDYERWQQYSAYFNGDAVRIEAISPIRSGRATLLIAEVISESSDDVVESGAPRTICGALDDRILSSDPRVARVVVAEGDFTSVCTATIIGDGNRCFLTSGGCAGALGAGVVIEFNAPLSYPNGETLIHPAPADQYVADGASVQRQTGEAGDDWGYFGCFPNSTTGLTPFESQGEYFDLADEIPAASNQTLRTFGNGVTVPPVFRTWSFVAKEVTGPFVGQTGDELRVVTDATFGDSGAAVTVDATGEMIGILVDDGCAEFAGANLATSVNDSSLRKALSAPTGVCIPLTFTYPGGRPEFVHPNGGTTMQVVVTGANGTMPAPDSGQFHYNAGDGWITEPMLELSPGLYEATFPSAVCGTFIDYYVSVETSAGVRFPDQIADPQTTFRTVAATGITVLHSFDFEDGTGWTLQDLNVTAGGWARGIPMGDGALNGPDADADGSGQCWTTGLADNVDLDGGPTRLRSPSFNLSAANNPFLSFEAWFTTNDAVLDRFSIQFSNNGGLSFATVADFGDQGPGWQLRRYRIADLGSLTSSIRFRFNVSDQPNNSETEAGLDALTIIDYACDSGTSCTKGDFNGDMLRDGRDVAGFANALVNPPMPGTTAFCAADMDDDGSLELGDDLQSFVQCVLLADCP
ncbi:MAG: hypothetical protein H6818_02390 [Phycisphaerales bacterium]|nr:hypothetical protein [Phycisphaerales bacterium]MCB9863163.1 hypothetical protein [Phycisphaerales bacterium]